MDSPIKTALEMGVITVSGWAISKSDVRFFVEMICLITPVVLSVLVFIRSYRKEKRREKNDANNK